MKKIFSLTTACILFTLLSATAQPNSITKYYDEQWNVVPSVNAFFYTEFVPEKAGYTATSRWMKSKKIYGTAFQSDTLFTKTMGQFRRYYENGQLKDSSYYDPQTGTLISTYYYYESGKLWARYSYNPKTKIDKSEGYYEDGKKMPDFVYQKEAQFKNGSADWIAYLSEHIKSKTPVKKGAPKGTYQVIVRFIISPDGSLTGVLPETNLGYGMEEEALRVIKKSPKWTPAISLNKPVNAYRRQPLTFVVEEK